MKRFESFVVLFIALILSYGAGLVGSFFSVGETNGEWYASVKPAITPPNWLFPIVWNILFFLIALSIWIVWTSSNNKKDKRKIGLVYGTNLLANILWSLFYFKLHSPLLAFIDLILIAFTIVLAMILNWRINKSASWILLPYLIWVTFAGLLNLLSISW